jgi:Arm DNA-binding domain/Phage integrase family
MADTSAATPRKKPKKLTPLSVANLKPSDKRREVPDGGCAGLYRVLQPSGSASWAVRYRFHGQQKKITLNGNVSLAAARKEASNALHQVEQGNDPAEQRQAAKAKAVAARDDTVLAICEQFFKREGSKLRTAAAIEATLKRHVYPVIGAKQIDTVKRSEITKLLDKIEDKIKDRGGDSGERTADLVLAYLRRIFRWHEKRTDEFRSPIISGMSRYSIVAHARKRVLNDDEIRALWAASATSGTFGALMRFLLLTAARRNEGARLPWSEIEDGNNWLLPAARNKKPSKGEAEDLLRPLSRAAQDLIAAQPRLGPFVFSLDGSKPITFGRTMDAFREKCGTTEQWQAHDLRRTARSLMSRVGVSVDHAERCLGHRIPGVRRTYDRHPYDPEMQIAFKKLAAEIERIAPPGDTVVQFPQRQG